LLIDAKAAVDVPDDNGVTPLMVACQAKQVAIAYFLVQHGALLSKSVFAYAANSDDNEEVLCWLLSQGATPDTSSFQSSSLTQTVFQDAVARGRVKTVQLLLQECKIPVDAVNDHNQTALHLLLKSSTNSETKTKLIHMLVDAGADVERRDESKKTPLMLAIESSTSDSAPVLALLGRGASAAAVDAQGRTALFYAVESQLVDAIPLLLQKGVNIDATDCEGQTALMTAVSKGLVSSVLCLLKAGASKDLKDRAGQTALQCAQENLKGCGEAMKDDLLKVLNILQV